MKSLKDLKREALKDSKFKQEYERYDLGFEVGQMVLEARLASGMSQKALAAKLGTKQPAIARLENGINLPSLSFLNKTMNVMGFQIHLSLTPTPCTN